MDSINFASITMFSAGRKVLHAQIMRRETFRLSILRGERPTTNMREWPMLVAL